ncbi:MAG: DUF2442 domain-containing protein [Nitrospirota bacterium]
MVKVSQVEATNNYELLVKLSNGKEGIFDVKPYLDKGTFTELKDKNYFILVRPVFGGVGWPHEQDFSADTIEYELQSNG